MKAVLLPVAGWLAAIVIVALLVVDGRSAALERAARSSQALAQLMEEHTVRTFQGAHLTLAAVADAWTLARPRKNDPRFQALLRERVSDLPYVRALFVIGPDGFLIHDTDYPRTPQVSLADRPYFKAHRDNPALQQGEFGPVLSRTGGAGWFVAVTHRLGGDDRFEGIVVAALQPAYFEALYRKLQQDGDEAIALFHRDGTLVARFPAAEQDTGKSFADLPLFAKLADAPSGSYPIDGHMMPGRRTVSYRAVESLPFVVHVSRSEHAVLAEWRRTALGAGIAMGALTLLLGAQLVQQLRTRRRRAEARAQRAQADKLEAMGQLTGGIAHDFNNLLGIIAMNTELIARKAGDAQAVEHAAAGARRAVERGMQLVARLLAFARAQPLEVRAADLNSLIAEAHPLVAQAAGARVELVLQLAPGLAPVQVDASQFEMALLNLVVNARDAMAGRGRIVLRTHAAPDGAACLTVEDEGPGMSEAIRRRALEPFFTTKGKAGTGLGLAQVYGFMRQIGGDLEIESAPGKGTRMHLRFRTAKNLTGVNAVR